MNEKSILPMNAYSAFTPPFKYTPFIDLQVNFTKICKNRLASQKFNVTLPLEHKNLARDQSPTEENKRKKALQQREFVFGADYEDTPHGKTTVVNKFKHRKGLSLIENISKIQDDAPQLVISTSPTKVIKRFISPYVKETKESPRVIKEEVRKYIQSKKHSVLPLLVEDDSIKNKEFAYDYFLKALRASNGIHLVVNELKNYKFYVGPGNNSELVVKSIRNRPWWIKVDSAADANFVWTSFRHKKTLKKLPVSAGDLYRVAGNKKLTNKKALEIEKNGYNLILKASSFVNLHQPNPVDLSITKLHNRLYANKHLVSKKRLFINLRNFYNSKDQYPFCVIPLTFHVKNKEDLSFKEFKLKFEEIFKNTGEKLWIVKPGENTNRGKGIKVKSSIEDIYNIIAYPKEHRTYVIQKYIERPLLIYKRKFDIRCFGLITSFNSNMQGYFYPEGYIRTSSKEFSLKSQNKFIHLTNDAIQKNSEEYGKFEPGNKLNYLEFQNYLDQEYAGNKISFEKDINSQIRKTVVDTFQACIPAVDLGKRLHSFELLGYDFMVDEDFHVWLIEVNTNPCLELSCSYLSRLIPAVLDNALRLTIDQMFCPNVEAKKFQKWIPEGVIWNKFELVFSEQQKDC